MRFKTLTLFNIKLVGFVQLPVSVVHISERLRKSKNDDAQPPASFDSGEVRIFSGLPVVSVIYPHLCGPGFKVERSDE